LEGFFWDEGKFMGKDFLEWDFLMEKLLSQEELKSMESKIMLF